MLATLSRWRSWVRIPPVLPGIHRGRSPDRATRASAGHWRAQVAVTHPPSGTGGSTPSRRTRSRLVRLTVQDISLSSCKCRVRFPHESFARPSGAIGRHTALRTPAFGHGSSNLPLVTEIQHGPERELEQTARGGAGGAGARPALIRPARPVRYRGLQLNIVRLQPRG